MNKIVNILVIILLVTTTGCMNNEKEISNNKDHSVNSNDSIIDTPVSSEVITIMNIELAENITPIIDLYKVPYPRLAMWWLDPYEESAETISKYDLLLNEMDSDELIEKLKEIRLLNNDLILLRPLSPSENELIIEWKNNSVNAALIGLPTQFFLMHQGSKLIKDIDHNDKKIYVQSLLSDDGLPLFLIGDDIAIGDNESARVTNINETNNSLTVKRGYIRESTSHKTGEGVSAHVRFWPGSWVMNITSACPTVKVPGVNYPVDYMTYYHLLMENKVTGLYDEAWENPYYVNSKVKYDGFVIDRFEDHQSWLKWTDDDVRLLDPYVNGRIISDEEIDQLVMETVDQFTELLDDTYDNPLIIRNNATTVRHDNHDGQVYESFGWNDPSSKWWESLFGSKENIAAFDDFDQLTYLAWFRLEENPLIFMEVYEDESGPDPDGDGEYINPLEDSDYKLNEQRFRFSLTSTLLGDGFYSYEVNTNGHGALGLLWFDAYDLGTDNKGYLGYPVNEVREVEENIFIREFEHGLVIVNASAKPINPKYNKAITPVSGFDPSNGINGFDGCIYLYD